MNASFGIACLYVMAALATASARRCGSSIFFASFISFAFCRTCELLSTAIGASPPGSRGRSAL